MSHITPMFRLAAMFVTDLAPQTTFCAQRATTFTICLRRKCHMAHRLHSSDVEKRHASRRQRRQFIFYKYIYIYIYIYNLKTSCTFSRFHQTLSFYDSKLSADSVIPTSEFRTSVMLLLLDYKAKLLPFQVVRTYKGSRNTAPLILHPGTRDKEPPFTQ
jgi:hypothetical protein